MIRNYLQGAYPTTNGKWRAQIKHNYKNFHIGVFEYEQEAHEAYKAAFEHLTGQKWRSKATLEEKLAYLTQLVEAQ